MKIIIIGAGLSGLATAIALRKYVNDESLEVIVYDKPDTHSIPDGNHKLKNQGAAISLQRNALKVLHDLSPQLAENVKNAGLFCSHFTWKTAGDVVLGREYLDLLPISRPILVQSLKDALPKDLVVTRTVTNVISAQGGRRPKVIFDDGGEEEADLVIGADGIHSPVRKTLFGDGEEVKPIYLGNCAVGGVLEHASIPQSYLSDPSIVFILGATGTLGYCGLNQQEPNKVLFFSFYDTDVPSRDTKLDHGLITKQLQERHKDWSDPIIQDCLHKADLDNIYPIFYMPDLSFWGRDGVVLVGDAAHAMPPSTGQGGSQAFEDGQTLALLLAKYLQTHEREQAVERTISAFYDVRSVRVAEIKAKGLKAQARQPKRPWSLFTTLTTYALFVVMLQIKRATSFFTVSDVAVHWDAQEAVARYKD